MIKKDDVLISYIQRNGLIDFIDLTVEFTLFDSIICNATLYKDLKTEDEIHNEIVRYMNSKITKD